MEIELGRCSDSFFVIFVILYRKKLGESNFAHIASDREFEVFSRIVRGTSLTAIAQELSLSIKTVSTHKSNLLHKMQMGTQIDLVRYAMEHQLLDDLPHD